MSISRYQWDRTHPGLTALQQSISTTRRMVLEHGIYRRIDSLDNIRTFQENHVFAVWDFMSLLKSLQQQLTCVRVPWVPDGPQHSRRLINEIVLVEESDELGDGFTSHFELYLAGMRRAGSDTTVIETFLDRIRAAVSVPEARESIPPFISATVAGDN